MSGYKATPPSFIARIYDSFRYSLSWIEVLAHKERNDSPPLIEIMVQRNGKVTVMFLTPEDGEAVIEAIRKAIDVCRSGPNQTGASP